MTDLFLKLTINRLLFLWIDYEWTICFAKLQWIHEFTIFFSKIYILIYILIII